MKFDTGAFDVPITELEACGLSIMGTEEILEYCDEMIDEYEITMQSTLNRWRHPEYFKEYNGQNELKTD